MQSVVHVHYINKIGRPYCRMRATHPCQSGPCLDCHTAAECNAESGQLAENPFSSPGRCWLSGVHKLAHGAVGISAGYKETCVPFQATFEPKISAHGRWSIGKRKPCDIISLCSLKRFIWYHTLQCQLRVYIAGLTEQKHCVALGMASALLAARRKSHGTISAAPVQLPNDDEFELVLLPRDGRFYSGQFEMVTTVGLHFASLFAVQSQLFVVSTAETRATNIP